MFDSSSILDFPCLLPPVLCRCIFLFSLYSSLPILFLFLSVCCWCEFWTSLPFLYSSTYVMVKVHLQSLIQTDSLSIASVRLDITVSSITNTLCWVTTVQDVPREEMCLASSMSLMQPRTEGGQSVNYLSVHLHSCSGRQCVSYCKLIFAGKLSESPESLQCDCKLFILHLTCYLC